MGTQKIASYAAIDAMDDLYVVFCQYFTSIDTSHGCPRILKTESNSHTTIRRIEKIDLIETWMAPDDSKEASSLDSETTYSNRRGDSKHKISKKTPQPLN